MTLRYKWERKDSLNRPASEERPHVVFFFWDGYLGVAPSIINAVRLLSDNGYDVDIITRSNQGKYPPTPKFQKGIRILECIPFSIRLRHRLLHITKSKSYETQTDLFMSNGKIASQPGHFSKAVKRLFNSFCLIIDRFQFLLFSIRTSKRLHYICCIGVDREGLIPAILVGAVKKIPVIYWSLEIAFLNDFKNPVEKCLKIIEAACNRRASFTIIQDKYRAGALSNENKVDPATMVIVPNGPLGPPHVKKSNYFRDKFNIKPSCKIILQIGMIDSAVLSAELSEVAASWSDSLVLILHERKKRSTREPYLTSIQEIGRGRVLLSLDPVPYDELDYLVSSADIGVVLYRKELGPNFSLISGASGKLGHYLRCALPVICIDLPGLGELVRDYQCGLVITDIKDATQAINTILDNYNYFSLNAVTCYQEVFEFSTHFQKVISKIQEFITS